ncbi:MAG: hypothetical protein KAI80_06770, partial [Hyphomicrobiaceae bacterium]|nr:hypothetical protein [Hyphomicrobiaceae bacterium]
QMVPIRPSIGLPLPPTRRANRSGSFRELHLAFGFFKVANGHDRAGVVPDGFNDAAAEVGHVFAGNLPLFGAGHGDAAKASRFRFEFGVLFLERLSALLFRLVQGVDLFSDLSIGKRARRAFFRR